MPENNIDTVHEPCEECGELIHLDAVRVYYKSPDERFWHKDCVPEDKVIE